MKEWFTIAELAEAALPGLPKTYKSLENHGRAYEESGRQNQAGLGISHLFIAGRGTGGIVGAVWWGC
ncbi:hypothetical protein [Bartonella sp. MR110HLJHH]|uniref:hypothetical protein n=1 Tax=Bartonella sp. MR110HLJHH TaxID=3243555 RepID=UPI0035CFA792